MQLIIGGKAQGKLDYAKKLYNLSDNDVAQNLVEGKKIIYNLQDIVGELLSENKDAYKIITEFAMKNDCIFICNEVGSGLVPTQKTERYFRDTVGDVCLFLAKESSQVHRVFCGIGSIIK